jgi:hypothetical protein
VGVFLLCYSLADRRYADAKTVRHFDPLHPFSLDLSSLPPSAQATLHDTADKFRPAALARRFGDVLQLAPPGLILRRAELAQHVLRILPWDRLDADQRTVAAVGIAGKIINDGDDFSAQRRAAD